VPSSAATTEPTKESFLRKHVELITAVLLGLVAIVTAYASFQSSLYDGLMTQKYTVGSNEATLAESIYLEQNQQWVQDVQTYSRLQELQFDTASTVAGVAESAQAKYDWLYFTSVSDGFHEAIVATDAQNAADPDVYYDPSDDEVYLEDLFASYYEQKSLADTHIAEGDAASQLSDRLTLNTVLMAVSLFLLGVSAVVRTFQVKIVLMSVSMVIFLTAAVLTAGIPFIGL
jgi:hypothetical protein